MITAIFVIVEVFILLKNSLYYYYYYIYIYYYYYTQDKTICLLFRNVLCIEVSINGCSILKSFEYQN